MELSPVLVDEECVCATTPCRRAVLQLKDRFLCPWQLSIHVCEQIANFSDASAVCMHRFPNNPYNALANTGHLGCRSGALVVAQAHPVPAHIKFQIEALPVRVHEPTKRRRAAARKRSQPQLPDLLLGPRQTLVQSAAKDAALHGAAVVAHDASHRKAQYADALRVACGGVASSRCRRWR